MASAEAAMREAVGADVDVDADVVHESDAIDAEADVRGEAAIVEAMAAVDQYKFPYE